MAGCLAPIRAFSCPIPAPRKVKKIKAGKRKNEEKRLMVSSSWGNYSEIRVRVKEYFIKQAIQKEIEFVKSVQIEKAKMVVADTNAFGKVIIK